MSDRRRHRGPHPADHELFADSCVPVLRRAVADLSWLLTRDYSDRSALKLVGDRYQLKERQRTAIMRCACSDAALDARNTRRLNDGQLSQQCVAIDGFNLITTIEAAISGGVLIRGRDGCLRDMASMHGTWRRVDETTRAIELLGQHIASRQTAQAHWLLDRPVSNSGRLSALLQEVADQYGWPWTIELHRNPDSALIDMTDHVIASADGIILQRCRTWWPLATEVIDMHIDSAWILDLG